MLRVVTHKFEGIFDNPEIDIRCQPRIMSNRQETVWWNKFSPFVKHTDQYFMIRRFTVSTNYWLCHQDKRIVIQRILQRSANFRFINNVVAKDSAMLRLKVFRSAVGE